jgi:DNA repair exonuclease SbcCD ATPase subunit
MSVDNQDNQDPQDDPKDIKTYSDEEFKKVVAQRDSIKAEKLAIQVEKERLEAEKKALGEDELKKKGELQTLLDNKEKDLAELKSALENAKQYETKYTELDSSIRTALLSQLPDEMKEVAMDLTTAKLQKFVELNKAETPAMDNGRAGSSKINLDGKKWDDFSSEEKEMIKKSDLAGYSRMFRERYGRNPSQT